jgi:hypothetical protein
VTTVLYRDAFSNPLWEQVRDRQDVFSGVFAFSLNRYNLSQGGEARYALGNRVSGQYFETLGVHTVLGRTLTVADDKPGCPCTALLSYDPLGKTYRWRPNDVLSAPVEIVGVVKDAKYFSLREPVPPTAYRTESQERPRFFATIEIRSNTNLIPAVKSAMAEVSRDVTLQFTSFATQVDESLVRERLLATLSGFFGALALLLATIGLYGVMSYNVARRRNEIGIRMALGAEQSRVLRMVLREVCMLIFIGLAVGFAATLATTRFVASFLYDLTPNDPRTLASAAAVLAIVAIFAGYLPARRASRLDPMTALREE